jgi:death-on-curing protein
VIFLNKCHLISWQARLIQEHGGRPEIRDEAALESALIAAQNRLHYESADGIGCAAAYAYHLTNSHAFLDGNKRIAAVATEVFLETNGIELAASESQLLRLYVGIAGGRVNRDAVETTLRKLVKKKYA